jgi:UDP-glucose 4-epimerase
MTQYLVTGGAGFIGSHVTGALVARGGRVRVLDDLSSGTLANLEHLSPQPLGSGAPVEFVEGKVTDSAKLARACEGVEAIFHEAAQVSVPQSIQDPVGSYETNVMGTLSVLEAARHAGVGHVVFAASSAAYGESEELPKVETMTPSPLSPYASGKVAGEHLLTVYGRAYGISTVSLRYFNIFGPRQADESPYTGVIAVFAKALLEGRQATIYGDGEQTRDFTFIDNVVAANLAAAEGELEPGTVVNIGTGSSITVNDLYRAMADLVGIEAKPLYAAPRPGDILHSVACIDRARKLLAYRPQVDWRTGLEATVSWYRDRLRFAAR